ncbi:Protein N-terminal glutamine amidohydrolase, alpha beta roll [Dillenia turbinata]|uniref:Protein N-terminal glutamine amidohydrolase n=1 Tax=Dillenia turbinata TaxID=194707 RepID=A0AAN8VWY6_9MAGN
MKDPGGNWIYDPPAYEPIVAEDGTVHNLDQYLEMSAADVVKNIEMDVIDALFSEKFGVLVTETQMEELFSVIP